MDAIETRGLGKSYSGRTVLSDVSFTVAEGAIAALLGPNGAGKSTTIGVMVGLLNGSGECRFYGERFVDLARPSGAVGVLVDGSPLVPAWTPRQHLETLSRALATGRRRVEDVLDLVALREVESRPIRGLSLGMRQRLGIALTLLDNPRVLVLDEPSGGLDPIGTGWLFSFLRDFADRGGSVLVSSHQLADVEAVADSVIFLHRGRVRTQGPMESFVAGQGPQVVRVGASGLAGLNDGVRQAGGELLEEGRGYIRVTGITPEAIGRIALERGLEIYELTVERGSLQTAFEAAGSSLVEQLAAQDKGEDE